MRKKPLRFFADDDDDDVKTEGIFEEELQDKRARAHGAKRGQAKKHSKK